MLLTKKHVPTIDFHCIGYKTRVISQNIFFVVSWKILKRINANYLFIIYYYFLKNYKATLEGNKLNV